MSRFSSEVRAAKSGGEPVLIEKELWAPRKIKNPARIGVQFMGDLYHESTQLVDRKNIALVMAHTKQHTFIILTKRPENIIVIDPLPKMIPQNIWLGASCENQKYADERISHLLKVPAVARWLSLEPLLGPIDIYDSLIPVHLPDGKLTADKYHTQTIQWVVIGCESGPKRRLCKLEWVQDIVEQCGAAGVACWVKQISIGGKVETDIAKFPKELQVRELPDAKAM